MEHFKGAHAPSNLVHHELTLTHQLPALYNEIINHPKTSDELRRETESKVLLYKRQYLFALPAGKEKDEIRGQVEEMANGAVVLQVPDELAWITYLELKDCATVGMLQSGSSHSNRSPFTQRNTNTIRCVNTCAYFLHCRSVL